MINSRRALYKAFILLLALSWVGVYQVHAQKRYKYFSFGPSLGTCHYQGDLDDNGFDFWTIFEPQNNRNTGNAIKQRLFRPGIGFNINYHFHPHMHARFSFMQGWIGASDSTNVVVERKVRNLHFRSPLTEFSLQLVYEFFATERHYRYRPNWSPYVASGIAVYRFNPKAKIQPQWKEQYPEIFADLGSDWVALQPLGTEGQYVDDPNGRYKREPYKLTQFSIPLVVGVRRKLTDKLDLRFEIGIRKTFTDYLDDTSGPLYADPIRLREYNPMSPFFADRSIYSDYGMNPFKSTGSATVPGVGAHGVQQVDLFHNDGKSSEIRGNVNNNDWYAFMGFSLTLILDKEDRCPQFR